MIKKNVAQATRMANRCRPLLINLLPISDCQFNSSKSTIGQSTIENDQCRTGISSAGIICNDVLSDVVAAPNEKSAFALPLAVTVTSCGGASVPFAPPSCQAMTVYLPGGKPLIS